MRDHDVVVYGATGFVGKLTAEYLARAAPEGVRIALGGRSQSRLEQTRATLGARAAEWPLVVANSADTDAVAALAASTRVVATSVGPYGKYGVPLVQACAAHGTHYADLTGEVLFMRTVIATADAPAKASGARIVPTCGFDSIPSDLGVFLLAEHAREHGLGDLLDTTLVVIKVRGGASGGTIDTLRTTVDAVKADKAALRTLRDPYALSPARAAEPDLGAERDPFGAIRDDELGGWFAPFVMGTVNSRVVRRQTVQPASANALAAGIGDAIRSARIEYGTTETHLYLACPWPLAALLGWHLASSGPIVSFEATQDRAGYVRTCRLT